MDELERGLSRDLVEPCAVWSYSDDATKPDADWRAPDFDDADWKSGRAVLGYGNDDETTVLSFGSNPKSKNIGTYFRTTFQVAEASKIQALTLGLLCDDGAAFE